MQQQERGNLINAATSGARHSTASLLSLTVCTGTAGESREVNEREELTFHSHSHSHREISPTPPADSCLLLLPASLSALSACMHLPSSLARSLALSLGRASLSSPALLEALAVTPHTPTAKVLARTTGRERQGRKGRERERALPFSPDMLMHVSVCSEPVTRHAADCHFEGSDAVRGSTRACVSLYTGDHDSLQGLWTEKLDDACSLLCWCTHSLVLPRTDVRCMRLLLCGCWSLVTAAPPIEVRKR